MGERHVTALLSEAYDGMLDDATRRRVEDHLAGCAACAAVYADLAAAADALGALPRARMPVAVHLPSTPPVAAPLRLRERLVEALATRRARAASSVGGFALAGAAAVIVAITLHGAGSPATPQPQAQAVIQPAGGQDAANGAVAYPYFVTASVPGHPGQVVTLATSADRVHAGQRVPVLLHLGPAGGAFSGPALAAPAPGVGAAVPVGSAPVPTVRLLVPGAGLAASAGAPAPAARASSIPAIAAAPSSKVADAGEALTVTVPSDLVSGETVQLVVEFPGPNGATVIAVLTLTIA